MLTPVAVPGLAIACDPDSQSSALAAARRRDEVYVLELLEGGGSRRATWQTITGQRAWLQELRYQTCVHATRMAFVVESQAPDGPQSADCEALRRVRYHWEATCEVERVEYVEVGASVWQQHFLRGEVCKGAGARKAAYQLRAKSMTTLATNEDRCAALGILAWYVEDVLRSRLVCTT
jgi:hypothetical protein